VSVKTAEQLAEMIKQVLDIHSHANPVNTPTQPSNTRVCPYTTYVNWDISRDFPHVTLDRWVAAWNKANRQHNLDKFLHYVSRRQERLAQFRDSAKESKDQDNLLGSAWNKLTPHEKQRQLWMCKTRFRVVPAGRRSGKTAYAKRYLVKQACIASMKALLGDQRSIDSWFVFAAPTHAQAKRIYWREVKKLIPPEYLEGAPQESELIINLKGGVQIQVVGMDRPERIEGRPLNGIVLDEYGNMKPEAWTEHIRPSLTDRNGWAWFIGVPEGRNHYYDLYLDAQSDTTGDWATFTWTTEEVLPLYLGDEAAQREIESAKHDLDPLTYSQEYCASFVTFTGVAYYQFGAHNIEKVNYDPDEDLVLCFDFNVAPGVAVALHERNGRTEIVGEVHIPRNSNTLKVCDKIIQLYGAHKAHVYCYGDATAGTDGTAKIAGNDWALIKQKLAPVFGSRLHFRVPPGNPRERIRVNSVNSRLKSVAGDVKVVINPSCKHVIKDFEGVIVLEGGDGEIDKDATPELTHLTDAFGYYVHKKYPIAGGIVSSGTHA
jgi:hypothetical protein